MKIIMFAPLFFMLVLTLPARSDFQIVEVINHAGICEPSGAVMLPGEKEFMVANDEDNELRIFALTGGGQLPTAGADLNSAFGLDPLDEDQKADFEGATWLNNRAYWIGSHSRSKKGNLRESRWQFFSTTINKSELTFQIAPTTSSHDLLSAIANVDMYLANAIQLNKKKAPKLAAENDGMNIEGLTTRADGRSMFIGLRNPISIDKRALVLILENPEGMVERLEKPILKGPLKINLNARGIRSIEYVAAKGIYLIVAGSSNDQAKFGLYRWTGEEGSNPVLIEGSETGLASLENFQPEAMFIEKDGKTVHLLSDDGDLKISSGLTCKASGKSQRSFRHVRARIEGE